MQLTLLKRKILILAPSTFKHTLNDPGTEFDVKADLVLLAMLRTPVHDGIVKSLGLTLDQRGNVKADMLAYQTRTPKVFAAGDMRRGQSLVVWAIREGRQAAHSVDKFLMGSTSLPR